MSEERKDILGVLTEAGEFLSPGEVADVLGKPRNTIKQRLWRMAQNGQVENWNGKYGITHNHDNRVTEETESGYPVTAVIGYSEGSESVKCIHGFAGGFGCYLCDENHPYRRGGAT
jgi:hypothetical protein